MDAIGIDEGRFFNGFGSQASCFYVISRKTSTAKNTNIDFGATKQTTVQVCRLGSGIALYRKGADTYAACR
jgi:hypothetical protein